MKHTEHIFTRAGAVYDCIAKADSFSGVSGSRKRPMVTGRTWWVAFGTAEYATVRWSGQEFASTEDRLAFEELVVASVGQQTPLPLDIIEIVKRVRPSVRPMRRNSFQATTCPLCRFDFGVTRAPLKPRVTEIRCRRCGDFHIDDVWMAWADTASLDTADVREAFARQSCEANASGLLLELTETARGTPHIARPLHHPRSREM